MGLPTAPSSVQSRIGHFILFCKSLSYRSFWTFSAVKSLHCQYDNSFTQNTLPLTATPSCLRLLTIGAARGISSGKAPSPQTVWHQIRQHKWNVYKEIGICIYRVFFVETQYSGADLLPDVFCLMVRIFLLMLVLLYTTAIQNIPDWCRHLYSSCGSAKRR